ncbi:MAG: ankyrin repeat domain-containing protein [Proteobacteria bacterium]|nr:ankyrin repeat domain-containing protein [Pseudomonadota bacterium]
MVLIDNWADADIDFWFEITLETLQEYLDNGADVHAQSYDRQTPLYRCVCGLSKARPEVVKALLDAGAEVNAKDKHGCMPIHEVAQWHRDLEILKIMLDAGADVSASNNYGVTPLYLAASFNRNTEISVALVIAGADINACNNDGRTALHIAVEGNQNPNVVMVLLKLGADAKIKDSRGQIPLDCADNNEALKGTDALEELRKRSQ